MAAIDFVNVLKLDTCPKLGGIHINWDIIISLCKRYIVPKIKHFFSGKHTVLKVTGESALHWVTL